MNSGIYKITNKTNNKSYIGSSNNIKRRWTDHRSKLNNNERENQYLQNSWNKHGEDNFNFEILLLCEEFELEYYEQWFLDNVVVWGFDYNIARCAEAPMRGRFGKENSFYGKTHTEETRRKISKTMGGEKSSGSKLKVLEVLIIRELLSTKKYTYTILGKMFNVSCGTISNIDNKKTWKHI